MTSSSPAQARTMAAIAHGWKPTGSAAGIPVKVAKDFNRADTGTKIRRASARGLISAKAKAKTLDNSRDGQPQASSR